MIDCVLLYVPPGNNFIHRETASLPGKDLSLALMTLNTEGSLSCHACRDTGPRVNGLIRRTDPIIRFVRHIGGAEDLTAIPTGRG